ncbi:MAG: cytochrome c [Gemmatimonadaceae bacterium]|nr:cytochrome c [Chitinophagaceae bacterium]
MKRKSIIITAILFTGILFVIACGNENSGKESTDQKADAPKEDASAQTEVHGTQIKEGDVKLGNPLDKKMIAEGQATYDMKCQSCHKLTDEKVVGPGWKDVTKRRTPVWIMNMITNVEMMLETDPEAQKLLEQCLVRMPNQNISTENARALVEFMRSNDGEK